jgi:hypothetical protein
MKGTTPSTSVMSNLVSLSNVSCTAEIGEEVDASCRPEITFHTPSGNSIVGVEVAWTVASGDGLISVTGSPCPDFKAALTQYSDNDGKTTVCWQLGNTPGLNTVEARATPSGEAPDGVKFVYDDGTAAGAEGLRFSATATLRATTTTVTCASPVVYKAGAWEHCTASVSDADGVMAGATTTIAYQNNINAGTATATASFAGDATHSPSSSSPANFTIDKAPATATAGSASMLLGSTVPSVSCTVTGLLGADATPPGAVTCSATPATPTSGGSFPIVPVVSPSNPPNYNVTLVNGTLTVTVVYTQVGCFAQPIYSVMPETKSAQRKGSNVPVKCTLKLPNGSPVTNATGDLIVYELNSFTPGTTPQPPAGAPSLSIPGAFQASSSGTYTYGLNTSPAFFKIGKAYLVRAFWNDNSTTSGYFIVK